MLNFLLDYLTKIHSLINSFTYFPTISITYCNTYACVRNFSNTIFIKTPYNKFHKDYCYCFTASVFFASTKAVFVFKRILYSTSDFRCCNLYRNSSVDSYSGAYDICNIPP